VSVSGKNKLGRPVCVQSCWRAPLGLVWCARAQLTVHYGELGVVLDISSSAPSDRLSMVCLQ